MTPADYLSQKGWQFKYRSNGWLEVKRCPFCDGGSSKDANTFAVNSTDGNYTCQRGKCSASGSFRQLQEHFGDSPIRTYNPKPHFTKKSYKPPITKTVDPDGPAKAYLGLRGFTDKSLVKRRVSIDDKGNIVLPYFENGERVMLKFRARAKDKSGRTKGVARRRRQAGPVGSGFSRSGKGAACDYIRGIRHDDAGRVRYSKRG